MHFGRPFQADPPAPKVINCTPLILTVDEIEPQLQKTRVHKAVAPGTPPAAVIRALAPQLAAWAQHFILTSGVLS